MVLSYRYRIFKVCFVALLASTASTTYGQEGCEFELQIWNNVNTCEQDPDATTTIYPDGNCQSDMKSVANGPGNYVAICLGDSILFMTSSCTYSDCRQSDGSLFNFGRCERERRNIALLYSEVDSPIPLNTCHTLEKESSSMLMSISINGDCSLCTTTVNADSDTTLLQTEGPTFSPSVPPALSTEKPTVETTSRSSFSSVNPTTTNRLTTLAPSSAAPMTTDSFSSSAPITDTPETTEIPLSTIEPQDLATSIIPTLSTTSASPQTTSTSSPTPNSSPDTTSINPTTTSIPKTTTTPPKPTAPKDENAPNNIRPIPEQHVSRHCFTQVARDRCNFLLNRNAEQLVYEKCQCYTFCGNAFVGCNKYDDDGSKFKAPGICPSYREITAGCVDTDRQALENITDDTTVAADSSEESVATTSKSYGAMHQTLRIAALLISFISIPMLIP